MMTCQEARALLYDVQTMRTAPDTEEVERGSMLALAKAHVLVCVMCSSFFEQEGAYVSALHDRVTNIPQPVPGSVLANTLQLIERARVEELDPKPARGFRHRIAGFFKMIFHSRIR